MLLSPSPLLVFLEPNKFHLLTWLRLWFEFIPVALFGFDDATEPPAAKYTYLLHYNYWKYYVMYNNCWTDEELSYNCRIYNSAYFYPVSHLCTCVSGWMLVIIPSRVISFIIWSFIVTATSSSTDAADVANAAQYVVGRSVGPMRMSTVRCIAVGVIGLMRIIGNAVVIAPSTKYPFKSLL